MNDRCYASYVVEEKPSYLNCKNSFQNRDAFIEWCHDSPGFMEVHDNQRWGLDKDILIQGNKTYSPETCCFVPEFVNNVFLIRNAKRGDYPCGVSKTRGSKTYKARCCTFDGRLAYSGFDTPLEAHMKWVEIKAKHTLDVIQRYRSLTGSREDVVKSLFLRYDQLIYALSSKSEITTL